MPNTSEIMEGGLPWLAASMLGADAQTAVSGAGTTQATATACTGQFIEVSTAGSNSGILLPDGAGVYVVYNGGANALKVYPPVGSYMNGTQNAAFSVTNAKTAIFYRSGLRFIGVLSA